MSEKDLFTWLGEKAAAYTRAYLLPPNRRAARSKAYKRRGKKNKNRREKPQAEAKDDVQPPYRYGRKVDK